MRSVPVRRYELQRNISLTKQSPVVDTLQRTALASKASDSHVINKLKYSNISIQKLSFYTNYFEKIAQFERYFLNCHFQNCDFNNKTLFRYSVNYFNKRSKTLTRLITRLDHFEIRFYFLFFIKYTSLTSLVTFNSLVSPRPKNRKKLNVILNALTGK